MTPPQPPPKLAELLVHAAWVRALAARLVDAGDEDADDLAQDVYVAALSASGKGEVRSPSGWLAGAARNLALRGRRSAGRRRARERAAARPEAVPDAHRLVEKAELQGRLIRAVTTLGEPERTTVLLRFFEGLSPSEIGARAGVPASTVRTRLARALERLRMDLDREHGGDRGAWCAGLSELAGPLLGAGASAASAGGLGVLTGVFAMKGWMQFGAAAAVLVVAVAGLRSWTIRDAASAEPSGAVPGDLSAEPTDAQAAVELADAGTPTDDARLAAPVPPRAEAADALPAEEPERFATLTARIVDERGSPLAGAELRLQGDFVQAQSGPDGAVELRVLLPDPQGVRICVVIAQHEGRATRYLRTSAHADATIPLGEIALVPGGVLRGIVVDPSGRAIPDARVFTSSIEDERVDPANLRRHGPQMNAPVHGIDADADGSFVLAGVTPGPARIWATAPDHGFVSHGPFEVRTGANAPLELVLAPLVPADVIAGIVRTPDGAPVAASIAYDYQQGTSHTYTGTSAGADGAFSITVVSRSPHNLVFRDPEDRWAPLPMPGVEPGGAELDVRFVETPVLTLRVAGADGDPLEEFRVMLNDVSGGAPEAAGSLFVDAAAPGSEGRLELRVPTVAFEIEVGATGYESTTLGPFQPDAAPAELVARLVALPGLEGIVTANGAPVAGAAVGLGRVYDEDELVLHSGFRCRYRPARTETRTDADGRFRVFAPVAGTYVVRAEARGFAAGEIELDADPHRAERGLVIGLGSGGSLAVRVLLPPGEDPAGRIVGVNHGDGLPMTARVDADGAHVFTGLAVGDWHVELRDEELDTGRSINSYASNPTPGPFPVSCRVFEGETTVYELDLRGRASGRLQGRLGLVDGAVGWSAALRRIDPGTQVQSDVAADTLGPGGTFDLSYPEPGSYRLILGSPGEGARLRIETTLALAAGATAWELELELGAIEGALRDPADASEVLLYRWNGVLPPVVGADVAVTVRFAPDAGGAFRLSHVPAGAGEIVRYLEDEQHRTTADVLARVTVLAGRTETVELP